MTHIVTDSSSDIPKDIVEKFNIEILPIFITYRDKTIREFYDIEALEYHKILLEEEEIPKTSQVSIETFKKCYTDAKEKGYKDLIYISINGEGSGTYQASCIARDLFYEEQGKDLNIRLIDSRSYSYVYGNTVIECAKLAKQNINADIIVEKANELIGKSEAVLGVYDLKFLKKSGRISGGSAFVGEALGIKPIALVADGGVNICDKARGESAMRKKIIQLVKEKSRNPEQQTACIMFGSIEKSEIFELREMLLQDVGFKNVISLPLGAAITTNTGPKSLAIFYQK